MSLPTQNILTPQALHMIQLIYQHGSFAQAAHALKLSPSTLTYRVRQLEETLDVLLFNRQSHRARLTLAGETLLAEGSRLLEDIQTLTNRIQRIATGWEGQLHIALDSLIDRQTVLELCQSFYELGAPTQLKLSDETLTGTIQSIKLGHADLAIGVLDEMGSTPGIEHLHLGQVEFVFVVSPQHPLAKLDKPLSDAQIKAHRAVAVADSTRHGQGLTIGLLGGQEVLTVPSMQTKLQAQLLGLGIGYLPKPLAQPYILSKRLKVCEVQRPQRFAKVSYAWARTDKHAKKPLPPNKALNWWLNQLETPATRQALLNPSAKAID